MVRLWRARGGRAACVLGVILVAVLQPLALAQSRVQFLAERLAYPPPAGRADDFRVRTNAALALGATADEAAVPPLCGALSDPSDAVRQAAAVGLRRLAKSSSLSCLRDRLALESSAAVKTELKKAVEATEASQAPPTGGEIESASARYYVSISRVANRSARPLAEVDHLVREAIAARLAQTGEYAIAPAGETTEAAKTAIGKRQLKGYYLATSVEKFDYSDEGLRIRVKIAVFSYPGKDLRGEVPASGTMPGARPGDTNAEDQLMGLLAARAAELFAQNFR